MTVKTFDCAGCSPFCYGGYHMTEDKDGYGDWVRKEDYDVAIARVAELEARASEAAAGEPAPMPNVERFSESSGEGGGVYPDYDDGDFVRYADFVALHKSLTAPPAASEQKLTNLQAEVDRLNAIINTPHADDFLKAVSIEGEHQRQRWGSEHDAGKTPADWFWLVGHLGGKALHAHAAGNVEKAEHHIITTAAACANWHRNMFGKTNMRPGIDGDAALRASDSATASDKEEA